MGLGSSCTIQQITSLNVPTTAAPTTRKNLQATSNAGLLETYVLRSAAHMLWYFNPIYTQHHYVCISFVLLCTSLACLAQG